MQVALAELLSGRDVVHIALGQALRDVQRRYDTLFAGLADATGLPDRDAARSAVAARRAIQDRLAEPLGLSLEEAAWGMLRMINAHMTNGIRVVRYSVRCFDNPNVCPTLPNTWC